MSTAKVSNRRMRDIQRAVHIFAGVLLFVYVYSPAGDAITFERAIQFVVIPVVSVTGLLMWQLPRLRRAFRRKVSAGSTPGE